MSRVRSTFLVEVWEPLETDTGESRASIDARDSIEQA